MSKVHRGWAKLCVASFVSHKTVVHVVDRDGDVEIDRVPRQTEHMMSNLEKENAALRARKKEMEARLAASEARAEAAKIAIAKKQLTYSRKLSNPYALMAGSKSTALEIGKTRENQTTLPTIAKKQIRGHSRLVAVATCLKAWKISPPRIASQALNARIPHMLPIGDF